MPNTTSAQKALRQSKRKQAFNIKRKHKYRSLIKELRSSVAIQSFDRAKELLPKVFKALDKAAKTNTIKDNTADRLKSRISKLIHRSAHPAVN